MSTIIWNNPNDPNPDDPTDYKIGTEGLEHAIENNIALSFVANIARALYPYAKIPAALAVGLLDWDANAAVPTYGKWAGPGWAGGVRKERGSGLCMAHVGARDIRRNRNIKIHGEGLYRVKI